MNAALGRMPYRQREVERKADWLFQLLLVQHGGAINIQVHW